MKTANSFVAWASLWFDALLDRLGIRIGYGVMMGAPNKIWVDGDYVYDTEADARADTDDARPYIRADLVQKLVDYTKELHEGDWNDCPYGLKEILEEIDL